MDPNRIIVTVHEQDCTCPRSPDCRGKTVVGKQDAPDINNRTYRDHEKVVERVRELAGI